MVRLFGTCAMCGKHCAIFAVRRDLPENGMAELSPTPQISTIYLSTIHELVAVTDTVIERFMNVN